MYYVPKAYNTKKINGSKVAIVTLQIRESETRECGI